LFFERIDGNVSRIDSSKSNYIWVQARFNGVAPLELYMGDDDVDILEVIRAKLDEDGMPDTFICFLLISGESSGRFAVFPKI